MHHCLARGYDSQDASMSSPVLGGRGGRGAGNTAKEPLGLTGLRTQSCQPNKAKNKINHNHRAIVDNLI